MTCTAGAKRRLEELVTGEAGDIRRPNPGRIPEEILGPRQDFDPAGSSGHAQSEEPGGSYLIPESIDGVTFKDGIGGL